ncbi:MAG: penicillin-binding protein 2 [Bacteroidales bacterium]|nr:penicillin-binding protein 2 [Bacteroidales bacterium]
MATEKSSTQPKDRSKDRIGLVLYYLYLLFLVASVVIVARIIHIQLTYEPAEAIAPYFRPTVQKVDLEPERGSIFARDGRLLAMSTPMYQVYMDCTVLKDTFRDEPEKELEWKSKARDLSEGLSRIYGDKTSGEYYDAIIQGREKGSKYLKIGSPIGHETLQEVKALPLFNEGAYRGGIITEKFDTRQYPYGSLARRAIGYVKDNSKSNGNNHIGLEGKYDYVLHGQEGYEWLKITDNRNRIHNYDSTWRKAVDGRDIRTTLDIDIQDIADRALRRQIEDNPKIEGGCMIVMDVKTGAIRAMVNLMRDTVSQRVTETYNMAIGRTGEPGSVFKSTTLMSLLEDGKVQLRDEIPTNHGVVKGYGFAADSHIYDYERQNNTDKISILHGFEISSNYVFRQLAIDHYGDNPKKMLDKLYLYKLGENYDFDLDGFKAPTLPDPDSPYWSATDLGSVAIGYSVAETPLHIVTFYNAIANKGKMMKPYLVESIEENGVVKEKRGPSILNGSICSRATADTLTVALKRVTEVGTGKTRLKGARCTVAGKTGTARIVLDPKYTQKSHNPYEDEFGRKQYQATFVGFFPADEPKYTAICVIYSNLNREIFYGGTLPALAFRELVDNVYAIDIENGEVLTERHSLPLWDEQGVSSAKAKKVKKVKTDKGDAVQEAENTDEKTASVE